MRRQETQKPLKHKSGRAITEGLDKIVNWVWLQLQPILIHSIWIEWLSPQSNHLTGLSPSLEENHNTSGDKLSSGASAVILYTMSNIQSYRYVKEQENVTDDQLEKIIGAELIQMIQMLDLVINLKMTEWYVFKNRGKVELNDGVISMQNWNL